MTSCAEWTGVLLSTLLKECGLKGGANWFVAEGAEEVKGASSMPIAKAMDDCILAYGMNGEAVRPQNGFPLRLMVPGFEGIFHTKWLRRIKLVDRYYMNYNDFGHLDQDHEGRGAGLPDRAQIGHHVPVRRTTAARPRLLRDQRPGLVRRRRHQAGGGVHRRRQEMEQGRDQGNATAHGPYPVRLSVELGRTTRPSSCRAARTNSVRFNRRAPRSPSTGTSPSMRHSACRDWTTAFSPGRIASDGSVTNGLRLESSRSCCSWAPPRWRRGPPTVWDARRRAEEIRAWDISIGPTGEELPPGRGTAKEGAQVYRTKGCAGCHGATGIGGTAPILKSKIRPGCRRLGAGANPAASLAVRDDGLGLHQSRDAPQQRGNADGR